MFDDFIVVLPLENRISEISPVKECKQKHKLHYVGEEPSAGPVHFHRTVQTVYFP